MSMSVNHFTRYDCVIILLTVALNIVVNSQKATGVPDKMFNACVSFVQDRHDDNKGSHVFDPLPHFGFKISNDVANVISFLDVFFHGTVS